LKNRLRNLKTIKSLLVATNNKGKLLEIKKLLPNTINFYSPEDFKLAEPIESGKTFEDNAVIKARYCAERSKLISLSDDSGLEITALKGKPGIYSARWSGRSKNFNIAIKKVFLELKKKKKLNKNNKARFYCSLAIAWPDGECKTFSGTVNGKISLIPKGNRGFGYDPIFIANGYKKTFGEISADLKDKISHRYKAFSKIKRFFRYGK
jgi:XTP/dITP diphosphohydrolase